MYDFEDEEDDVFGPPSTITPPKQSKIDFSAELNADQFAAVTANDGPALVLAGAGSGKTRTLTYRVAFLLENGVPPESILLLTFTNKASKQMLERVEELTGIATHRFSRGHLSPCWWTSSSSLRRHHRFAQKLHHSGRRRFRFPVKRNNKGFGSRLFQDKGKPKKQNRSKV